MYLSDREVAARHSVARPAVRRWAGGQDGFPEPVRIAAGTTRWRLSDLDAYERGRVAAARTAKPVRKRGGGK